MKSTIGNSKGGMILAMIMSLGITYTTVSFFLYADATAKIQKMHSLSNTSTLEMVRKSMIANLFDPYALTKTIYAPANNTLKRCYEDTTYDCPRGKHPMTVYNIKQDVIASPTSTIGFKLSWSDTDGYTCSNYSSSGNDACPFKYSFYWKPDCPPSGSCMSPNVSLIGELSYSPGANSSKMNINLSKYEINYSLK